MRLIAPSCHVACFTLIKGGFTMRRVFALAAVLILSLEVTAARAQTFEKVQLQLQRMGERAVL
jgi:hypothetical protein